MSYISISPRKKSFIGALWSQEHPVNKDSKHKNATQASKQAHLVQKPEILIKSSLAIPFCSVLGFKFYNYKI